ncbi:siroheme synthase-like protein [Arthrobacter sp. B2I5]|nr:siroheme synthase-like protein [Arthrobacter sp. B2I5]
MAIQDIYPTALRLLGRPVLVVGGGPVAARRAKGLLDAGAVVTVVAPVASPALQEMADAGLLTWAARPYVSSDVDGVWFVQTATGDSAVDQQVSADAEAQRVWCVNASNHEASAAWTPAVAEVDDVKIAINAGGDPRRAMAVRDAVATALETGRPSTAPAPRPRGQRRVGWRRSRRHRPHYRPWPQAPGPGRRRRGGPPGPARTPE